MSRCHLCNRQRASNPSPFGKAMKRQVKKIGLSSSEQRQTRSIVAQDSWMDEHQALLSEIALLVQFFFWLGLASLGGHAFVLHLVLARPLIRETSRLPAGAPNQRLTPLAKQPNCSSAAG